MFTKKKKKERKAACHFVPLCIHPDLFIFSQLLLTNIFFIKGRSFYNSQIDDPIFDSFLFCMLLENYLGHTLIINFNNFLKSYSLFHFFLKIFLKTYISQTFFLFLFFALYLVSFLTLCLLAYSLKRISQIYRIIIYRVLMYATC